MGHLTGRKSLAEPSIDAFIRTWMFPCHPACMSGEFFTHQSVVSVRRVNARARGQSRGFNRPCAEAMEKAGQFLFARPGRKEEQAGWVGGKLPGLLWWLPWAPGKWEQLDFTPPSQVLRASCTPNAVCFKATPCLSLQVGGQNWVYRNSRWVGSSSRWGQEGVKFLRCRAKFLLQHGRLAQPASFPST